MSKFFLFPDDVLNMHKIVVNSDNSHADYANEEYPAVAVRAF